jgi:hypothetical protein
VSQPCDKALESIITAITHAIAMSPDPRLVILQREAISMRSAEMVRAMEEEQKLVDRRERAIAHQRKGWR